MSELDEERVAYRREDNRGSETRVSIVENGSPSGFSICIARTNAGREGALFVNLIPEDARAVAEALEEGERLFGRPSRVSRR